MIKTQCPSLLGTILLFLLLALSTANCTDQPDYNESDILIDDMRVSSSLSNLRISSIAEDQRGYIWISTNRGLNRYNGDDVHQYFCNDQPNSIPDNRINHVFCDSKGRVWITSKNGVARYTERDDFEQIPILQSLPRSMKVLENSRGEIFVLQSNCILKYNEATNCFERAISDIPELSPYQQNAFMDEDDVLWLSDSRQVIGYSTVSLSMREKLDLGKNSYVQAISLVGHQLWIGLEDGLRIYDVIERKWCPIPDGILNHPLYNKAHLTDISSTHGNYVLLSSTEGLFFFNFHNGVLLHDSESQFPFSAPAFQVTISLPDSHGHLWLCSESQGFVVRQAQSMLFDNRSPIVNVLQGKPVSYMSLDRHNVLWIATQDEGIYCLDTQTKEVSYYDSKSLFPNASAFNRRIYCIFVDSDDNIWLSVAPKGLARMRRNGKRLEMVDTYEIPFPIVMNEDSQGNLWMGSYGNAYFSKGRNTNHFTEHHLFSNSFSYLSCMQQLHDGTFATLVRDQGLRFVNPSTLELDAPVIPEDTLYSCIRRNVFLPSALKEDAAGKLYIGTVSNGLMCYDPATRHLENIDGTPCEDIASIEIDQQGLVWVSTQYGIGKYNPETRQMTNYYNTDGLGGNEFYDRVSCRLPDGTLLFGGPHGLTAFNPNNLPEEPTGVIFLEDLKIHNKLVRPGTNAAIKKHLSLCEKVDLNHYENSFSLSFSALDFNEGERYSYQYMLEGFNHNWVEANGTREAIYANMKPGCYTFRVRITNKDRDHVIAETSVPISIHPAVWASWWARLLYLLMGVTVVVYIWRLYRRIRQEKWNRLQSQREKEHEHRINQLNMNFFANVSHEFRTPLTVISGPIGQLCQNPQIADDDHRLLLLVNRSVKRMLQLVNQMMDFHKLSDGALRLEVKRQDMVGYLKQTAEFFAVNAKDKNIKFTTRGLDDFFLMWMDADKVDKIVSNLLGNAMKYTPAHGEVVLGFDVVNRDEAAPFFANPEQMTDTQYVKISVADNGNGIPENERERIFDRYYQLKHSTQEGKSNWGTGIGLYFARSLALLHHGALRVVDNPGGKGACFCLLLPINKSAYTELEFADPAKNQAELFPLQTAPESNETPDNETAPAAGDDGKPHLLVIDDDVEVIHYMKLLLGSDYHVTCRFDAESALETLRRQDREVDLIISDVMMPGTSGIELCRQVKEDNQLCHIPIILVTAKSTVSDQIEGLKTGAVAYITKPFDPEYLKAMVRSLLVGRDHIRLLLQENTQTDALESDSLSSQDRTFMTELYKLMEEELSNPEMDITRMTELLHVSRSKLYYKIKGLTGENPSVFFRHYKLNRAAEMLKEGKYNISEISILTGFSTLSHFSASFKKQFGVSPSEYC